MNVEAATPESPHQAAPVAAPPVAQAGAVRRFWQRTMPYRHSFRFWVALFIGIVLLIVVYYVFADRYTPLTTDAFVQAYVVQVAPQVEGQVVQVYVKEGDKVAKGELLCQIDERPFEHRVAQLEAKLVETAYQVKQLDTDLTAARAEQRKLEAEAEYAQAVHRQEEEIYKRQSTTERKYLDAVQHLKASEAAVERSVSQVKNVEDALAARIGDEHASVAKVRAELAEARLNLQFCQVHAPCDGVITNLQLREGAYAHVGQALLACIDTSHWLIVANFRERSLEKMQVGQSALVAFQGSPGQLWPARVTALGSGVGQGQGVPSGMLPEVRDQAAWIPPAQRFQVRLSLDDPAQLSLRVGMTGSVSIYISDEGPLGGLTHALHRIISWLYYL